MSYDSAYPKKKISQGNPYYSCAYCGISDPQINGEVKNHAIHCEYREWKLFGFVPSHNGYGEPIFVKETFSWHEQLDILKEEGYSVIQEQPLILETKITIFSTEESQYILENILNTYME